MTQIQKPMLAGMVESVKALRYPVMVSAKLDGIRCLIVNGEAVSRNFKAIRNEFIRATLKRLHVPDGFDGELMVRGQEFSGISSGVMSADGQPDFYYNVFDSFHESPSEPFRNRQARVQRTTDTINDPRVRAVPHSIVHDPEELLKFEIWALEQGYEGVMVRDPNGPYKFGRSSTNEGFLLKLKRFEDGEAHIISILQQVSNQNEAGVDAFGRTKRSQAQDGMVLKEALGAFHVRDMKSGVEFDIGTGRGLTQTLRAQFWQAREGLIGKVVKYKSQKVGEKDAPRFPVWLGFRDAADMDGDA